MLARFRRKLGLGMKILMFYTNYEFKNDYLFFIFTFSSEKICIKFDPPSPLIFFKCQNIKNQTIIIKKSIFRPNYVRYEKMLKSKIGNLKKSTNLDLTIFWKNARFLF